MQTRRSLLAALSVGLAGCSAPLPLGDGGDETATLPPSPAPPTGERYWYTHPQATGNRTLRDAAGNLARGDLRGVEPVTVEPDGRPQWLVAHPARSGSHWTVATADGTVTRWHVSDGEATRAGEYDPLPPDTQPVVATGDGDPRLVRPPADVAARTSPMVAPADGDGTAKLLYVAGDGTLVIAGDARTRLAVNALTDGRLAALGDGRYALLTDPTDRYGHGALGDTTEGTTLTVVDAAAGAVDWRRSVGPPEVFEGLQPLVADLDGDGAPEVVTTVADSENGARIAVFSAGGDRLATGPIHEPGWRHQLLVGPLGPGGEPELAVVRKPHVDHLLEFYRLGEGLDIVATLEGFSTHTYGSRILSGALAADLDGDGAVEVLLPSTDRDELAAVRRTGGGAEVARQYDLGGAVGSNVTGVALDGRVAVGAAVGGTVSVWQG